MKIGRIAFDGSILKRGFWIYVAEISAPNGKHFYVGRTGDSSSPHASSLFQRVARHLESKPTAKSNALLRRLTEAQLECSVCSYRWVGIGPLYEQQASMDAHRPIRDIMAALERAVADHLRGKGHVVLGAHPKKGPVPPEILASTLTAVDAEFA